MLKKVVLKLDERELTLVKTVLKTYKESKPEVSISALRHGNLGDDALVSFNIDSEHFDAIIEKLSLYGIKALIPTNKSEREQTQAKVKITPPISPGISSEKRQTNLETPSSVLESSIEKGEYEKVIQLSKDFRSGHDVIQKAKDNLENVIKRAIDLAYEKAVKSKFEINSSVTQLTKIASDKTLKAMHLISYQKDAGLAAVKLCSGNREYLNLLIQICNDNAIPNIVCVRASLELAGLVLNGQENNDDLEYAVRYLNIKWLQIALDVVFVELSPDEKETIKQLISTVQKIRGEGKS